MFLSIKESYRKAVFYFIKRPYFIFLILIGFMLEFVINFPFMLLLALEKGTIREESDLK